MNKKILILLNVLVLGLSPSLYALDDLYKKIAQEYLTTPEICDINKNVLIPEQLKSIKAPQKKNESAQHDQTLKALAPADQKYLIYSFLHDHDNIPEVLSPDSWNELALYKGNSLVKSLIPFVKTIQGEVVLTKMVALPLVNPEQLQARQALVQKLIDNPELLARLEADLKAIAQAEPYYFALLIDHDKDKELIKAASLWNDSNDPLSLEKGIRLAQLLRVTSIIFVYGNFFGACFNFIQKQLKGSPIYTPEYLTATIFESIIAYGTQLDEDAGIDTTMGKEMLSEIRSFKEGSLQPTLFNLFFTYVWLPSFSQTFRSAQCVFYQASKHIQAELMKVAQLITASDSLYHHICSDPLFAQNILGLDTLNNFFGAALNRSTHPRATSIKKLIAYLESDTFKGEPSFFSQSGKVFASYNLFCELKCDLAGIIEAIGSIDVSVAMAKLYKEKQATSTPICFPQVVVADNPYLHIENGWNPTQPEHITSITLGADQARVALLANPDTVEQQTTLEITAYCILMAQVFGIVPARSMSFTPFTRINTCIDCNQRFNAQLATSQRIIDRIKKLQPNEFSFTLLNKLYSNGDPSKTAALEKAYTQNIAQYSNSLVIQTSYSPDIFGLSHQEPAVYKTCNSGIIN